MGADGARWPPQSSKLCEWGCSPHWWVRLPCALATKNRIAERKIKSRRYLSRRLSFLPPRVDSKTDSKTSGLSREDGIHSLHRFPMHDDQQMAADLQCQGDGGRISVLVIGCCS